MIVRVSVVLKRTAVDVIDWSFHILCGSHYQSLVMTFGQVLNVSHWYRQSFSGLHSPWRSKTVYLWIGAFRFDFSYEPPVRSFHVIRPLKTLFRFLSESNTWSSWTSRGRAGTNQAARDPQIIHSFITPTKRAAKMNNLANNKQWSPAQSAGGKVPFIVTCYVQIIVHFERSTLDAVLVVCTMFWDYAMFQDNFSTVCSAGTGQKRQGTQYQPLLFPCSFFYAVPVNLCLFERETEIQCKTHKK